MLLEALYYRNVAREQRAYWIHAEERSTELTCFLNQIKSQYIVLAGIPDSHYHIKSFGFSRIPLENIPSGTDRLILPVFYVDIFDVYYDSI